MPPELSVSTKRHARTRAGLFVASALLAMYDYVGDAQFVLYSFAEEQRQYRLRITGGLDEYRDQRWSIVFWSILAVGTVVMLVKAWCAIKIVRASEDTSSNKTNPSLIQLGSNSPFALFAGRRLSVFLDRVDDNTKEHPAAVATVLVTELFVLDISMLLAQLWWTSTHWFLDARSLISVTGSVAALCYAVWGVMGIVLQDWTKTRRRVVRIVIPLVLGAIIGITIWQIVPLQHPDITPPSIHCDEPSDHQWMTTIFTPGRQLITSDLYIQRSCPLHLLEDVEEVWGTVHFDGLDKQYNETAFPPRLATALSFLNFRNQDLMVLARADRIQVVNSTVNGITVNMHMAEGAVDTATITNLSLTNVTVQDIQMLENKQLSSLGRARANLHVESSSIGSLTGLHTAVERLEVVHSSIQTMAIDLAGGSSSVWKSQLTTVNLNVLHESAADVAASVPVQLEGSTIAVLNTTTARLAVSDSVIDEISLNNNRMDSLALENSAVRSLTLPQTTALRKLAMKNVTQLSHVNLSSISCAVENVSLANVSNLTMELPLLASYAQGLGFWNESSNITFRIVDICDDLISGGDGGIRGLQGPILFVLSGVILLVVLLVIWRARIRCLQHQRLAAGPDLRADTSDAEDGWVAGSVNDNTIQAVELDEFDEHAWVVHQFCVRPNARPPRDREALA
eukprot:m.79500 g.79500  ORF g.79500 m.79500 type:complete len:681 (+) comp14515_c1_seq2:42-2084(+)